MLLSRLAPEPFGATPSQKGPPPEARSAEPPPRLRALLAAAGLGCDAVLMLQTADVPAAPARLVTALAKAHAVAYDGHALMGQDGMILVLAPSASLVVLAADARRLSEDVQARQFRLPGDATSLVLAAGRAFQPPSVAGSARKTAIPPRRAAPLREAFALIARGAAPHLVGWRLRPADQAAFPLDPLAGLAEATSLAPGSPAQPPFWLDLPPGAPPPADFSGTAITPPAMLAEAATLARWRDQLARSGGQLGVGPLDTTVLRWLRPGAIPAHLLLLRWSEGLPGILGESIATIAPRSVLVGADVPAALAWGLRHGIAIYAGRIVDVLLAAQRLGACPLAAGCEATACATRAAATGAAGRAGCGNPGLLARWVP
ncbi:hypothetical protein ACQW02_23620 [Humitalea sp. 24SJ18S-53]|uniref:hypothetical protein n=1 Tax=Humitalea sp. 24SJ18S-53 TaxID=3422307 RepID=UPI003D671DCB